MKNTIENFQNDTQTSSLPLNNPLVATIGILAASFCICYITHENAKYGHSFELKYKDLVLTSSPCIPVSTTSIAA